MEEFKNIFIKLNNELYNYIKEKYQAKFESLENFETDLELYEKLPIFKANENLHEVLTDYSKREGLSDSEGIFVKNDSLKYGVHWIMRCVTTYYLTKAFKAMKVDLEDPNTRENSLLKSTPGRIAKMWLGSDSEDTNELGSGRWNKEPYISCFPNTTNKDIIRKEVDIVSCCSHHFLPFSTFDGGKAIIAYKPDKYVLGISKLQRFANWASRRFWLQEDLTQYLGETIKRIAETDDVYIRLEGLVHGCEKFRGANTKEGSLTTEFKSGYFKENSYN